MDSHRLSALYAQPTFRVYFPSVGLKQGNIKSQDPGPKWSVCVLHLDPLEYCVTPPLAINQCVIAINKLLETIYQAHLSILYSSSHISITHLLPTIQPHKHKQWVSSLDDPALILPPPVRTESEVFEP